MPTRAPSHPHGNGGFVALCLSLVLTACGGGDKGPSLKDPAQTNGPTAKALAAAAGEGAPSASEMASLNAGPQILQWELVSEKRVDRTRYDYTYRVLIGGAATNFETAAFKVTSSTPATVVMDGDINVGQLAAGQTVKVADTFTIRQDRTLPLNKQALQFGFTGTVPTPPPGSDPNIKIGAVGFYKIGGRSGHEGYLPINTSNPLAGQELLLRVNVRGNPSKVSYSLIDAADAVVTAGVLLPISSDGTVFGRPISVPVRSFKVRLSIESGSATHLSWESSTYTPAPAQVELRLENVSPSGATTITGQLVVPASSSQETYAVRLLLPDGFATATTAWTIRGKVGADTLIPVVITIPANMSLLRKELIITWRIGSQPSEYMSVTPTSGI